MTTTVNNEHKNIKVPNLRFPEFQGEWEKCKLGDICDLLCGYAFDGEDITEEGKYLLMRGINITEGVIRHSVELDRYYSGSVEKLGKYKLVIGDLVIGMDGSKVGRNSALVSADENGSYLVQRVCRIRSMVGNNYVLQLVNNVRFHKYVDTVKTSSAIPHISLKDIQNFKIAIPSTQEEANKISNLMYLLDERIATQNKIIDKLQSLIKGIMVELQKQGVDRGTWKKLSLGDVLSERNERNTNLYQVFSVSVSQGIVNQVDYLGRSFAAKDTSKYNVVHYGDLVYTKSPTGSFPYGIVKQSLNIDNVAVSPLYGVYEPRSFAIGAYLHEYFMSEINTHNYLHPLIQKGAKNTINITNQRFLENRVTMPVNSNELLLISKLLYSLNDKIKHVQNTLEEYHKQKQYLLRQMFI